MTDQDTAIAEKQEYAEILSMSDENFTEQQDLNKKFRSLLISLLK